MLVPNSLLEIGGFARDTTHVIHVRPARGIFSKALKFLPLRNRTREPTMTNEIPALSGCAIV